MVPFATRYAENVNKYAEINNDRKAQVLLIQRQRKNDAKIVVVASTTASSTTASIKKKVADKKPPPDQPPQTHQRDSGENKQCGDEEAEKDEHGEENDHGLENALDGHDEAEDPDHGSGDDEEGDAFEEDDSVMKKPASSCLKRLAACESSPPCKKIRELLGTCCREVAAATEVRLWPSVGLSRLRMQCMIEITSNTSFDW